jgi:hypothetical protein
VKLAMARPRALFSYFCAAVWLSAAAALAQDATAPEPKPQTENDLCALVEIAAKEHGLPLGFFTRLIWKESAFRTDALSPKGAQGIAQFMPGTAAERGLLDPFDPATALPASASLLADLKARFGNLGLAAAAYNAGAQRVADWLAETATLPWETQDFVLAITGIDAATWADPEAKAAFPADTEGEDCETLTARLKIPGNSIGPTIATASGPWGVQLAGNFSRATAISIYTALQRRYASVLAARPPMVVGARMPGRGRRPFYSIRAPAQSRQEAEKLCADLKAAGASCIVLKT